MENNFALASLAASSQYGRLLQAAVTVYYPVYGK